MNHSLTAVAARIQERNNALVSELATEELLKVQLSLAEQTLRADEEASLIVRKDLLSAVRDRHGLELECLQIKGETLKIDASITELEKATKEIREQTKELEISNEEQAPIYAKHDISTKLYSMRSEAALIAAQQKKQRREDKLRNLKEHTERQHEEANQMRSETESIRDECMELDRTEEEDDEETVGLSMQIKSLLAKKSSLRAALNDAREKQHAVASNREE
jgi:chromosome segregation ATPase